MMDPNSLSAAAQDLFDCTAELQLKFVVLGAELNGLTCAYNLKKAGHDVVLLESRALEDVKVSSSIRSVLKSLLNAPRQKRGFIPLPPNVTPSLKAYGLHKELDKYTWTLSGTTCFHGASESDTYHP